MDQTHVVEDVDLPLSVLSHLASGYKEHSWDFPIDLEPLHKFFGISNGEEGLMSSGCDSMLVRSVFGTEDVPVLGVEAKPGDHGKEQGCEEVKFKKLRRLPLVELEKTTIVSIDDNVVSCP